MSLKMGVVVEMWENKTGLKVKSVHAIQGQPVVVELVNGQEDRRVRELEEKLAGSQEEYYNGHKKHRTKLREQGLDDTASHTYYHGELKAQKRERIRKFNRAR